MKCADAAHTCIIRKYIEHFARVYEVANVGIHERRNRRTVADTSDVMRRNFASKQIRGPGHEQSIQRTGRVAEFEASDRAVPPRSKANLVNN